MASYADARAAAGEWVLRIEDVDTPRTRDGAGDAIVAQLEQLGFRWDGAVEWQSTRTARYDDAIERLRAGGHVFACAC
jgi:glutamyl-Q tRNA(Asp) synthetase